MRSILLVATCIIVIGLVSGIPVDLNEKQVTAVKGTEARSMFSDPCGPIMEKLDAHDISCLINCVISGSGGGYCNGRDCICGDASSEESDSSEYDDA